MGVCRFACPQGEHVTLGAGTKTFSDFEDGGEPCDIAESLLKLKRWLMGVEETQEMEER